MGGPIFIGPPNHLNTMELLKPKDTLPSVLSRERPHQDIFDFIAKRYGIHVILTGIKNGSEEEAYERRYTYGIPLRKLRTGCDMDLLDYAQNMVVVYSSRYLERTPNGDYEVKDPYKAVLGFVELGW